MGIARRVTVGLCLGLASLTLPKPTGGFERFEVYEAPIMEPTLAAAHPDIKT